MYNSVLSVQDADVHN